MKLNRRKTVGHGGFTLVELMITVLILGILVTIVVMTMSISRNKAQEASCKSNLRTLISSLSLYRSINGEYPPNLNDLVPDYLKSNFPWTCPAGDDDYRDNYDPVTGIVTCPISNHNP